MNDLQLQHGYDWQGEDLTGWYLSEKHDGCRAYWDGATLWTRGGNVVKLPDDWHLPAGIALDGELYDGGGTAGRARCSTAMRYGGRHFTGTMRFVAFDAPAAAVDWADRIRFAALVLDGNPHAVAVEWRICHGTNDAIAFMRAIQSRGGEGLMLRRPGVLYTPGRTRDLLKVKEDCRDTRAAA